MNARLHGFIKELDIFLGGLFFLIGAPLVLLGLLMWFLT